MIISNRRGKIKINLSETVTVEYSVTQMAKELDMEDTALMEMGRKRRRFYDVA